MKKEVKYFAEADYNKVIANLQASLPKAKELKKLMEIFDGLPNLEAIDKMFYGKTGFKNAEFSADALGVKPDYLRFRELVRIVDLSNYNDSLTAVAKDIQEKVREAHTKYYTAEESKAIKKVEKVLKQLNELDALERSSISINRASQFIFSPRMYATKVRR
jgi:F0F1-type ATP synthase beta subunit